MKHTPRPWTYFAYMVTSEHGHHIADVYETADDNCLGNGILIENAPEMLHALERTEQTVRNMAAQLPPGDLRTICKNEARNLRRDIAKARGE